MSTHRFTVDRVQPAPVQGTGHFHAGAAERDITPPFGLPMAGYSLGGKVARGLWGRLFARALMLQDADGSRVCLCICDLMSGTRPLLEKVAARTAASVGISVDRLVLTGTHTHNGPGGVYGNSLYDTFAQRFSRPGYEPDLVDWLARRIALTIEQAAGALEPAVIATGSERLWGMSKNRSPDAFPMSVEAWSGPGSGTPADDAPDTLEDVQKLIDPRVRVLAAYREMTRTPLAVFAWWGCHYHATGLKTHLYTSDAAGSAVRWARWLLEEEFEEEPVLVAVGASSAADVHTMRNGLPRFMRLGLPLARWVGAELGRKVAEAATAAQPDAGSTTIRVRYVEPAHDEPAPGNAPDTELAAGWAFGAPVLTGSEETPGVFPGLVREGMTDDDFETSDPPQHPKTQALGLVQDLLKRLLDLDPAPVYPLHQVRLGDLVLATFPGEITTVGAWEVEKALRTATQTPDLEVIAVPYSGDYGGYFTTEAEYVAQHYEGASTLRGRNTHRYLQAFQVELAGAPEEPLPSGTVRFETVKHDPGFSPQSVTFGTPDPAPRLTVKKQQRLVKLSWKMHEDTHLVLASEGPLIVVEEQVGTDWRPLIHMGRKLDDYWHGIKIKRDLSGKAWSATIGIPVLAVTKTLRVRVLPRSDFPGTVSEAFTLAP